MSTKKGPILFVDDHVSSVLLFKMHLSDAFDLEGFSSPLAAIERARERQFAVLVADYRMLEMNGLELAEHFRAQHPATIRVLYTALDHVDEVDRALSSGLVSLVLSKPGDLDVVAVQLTALLEPVADPIGERRR